MWPIASCCWPTWSCRRGNKTSGRKFDRPVQRAWDRWPLAGRPAALTTSQLPIDAEESENISNNESDLPKIQTYEEYKEEEKRLHEANDKELAEGVMNSITMKKTEMVEHLTIAENMNINIAISEEPGEKKTSQVELGREESSSTSESIKKPVHQEIKSTVTVSSNVTKIPSRASSKPVATPLQTVINAVAINKTTPAPSKQDSKVGVTKGPVAPVIVREVVKPLQEKASKELPGTGWGNSEKEYPK